MTERSQGRPKKEPRERVNISIPVSLIETVRNTVQETGQTISGLIEVSIKEYLERKKQK